VNQSPQILRASPTPILTPMKQWTRPNKMLRLTPFFQFVVPFLNSSSSYSASLGIAKNNTTRKIVPTIGIEVLAIIAFWPPASVLESSNCHQPQPSTGMELSITDTVTTNTNTTVFWMIINGRIRLRITRLFWRLPPIIPSCNVVSITNAAMAYMSSSLKLITRLSMYNPYQGYKDNYLYHIIVIISILMHQNRFLSIVYLAFKILVKVILQKTIWRK